MLVLICIQIKDKLKDATYSRQVEVNMSNIDLCILLFKVKGYHKYNDLCILLFKVKGYDKYNL